MRRKEKKEKKKRKRKVEKKIEKNSCDKARRKEENRSKAEVKVVSQSF